MKEIHFRQLDLATKTSIVQSKLIDEFTGTQTGILPVKRVQGAFKDSMIHEILQFTLRIAFRCVLHRCESQEIRCQKLFLIFL